MADKTTRMLYKYPGQHEIHGDFFDYAIVDDTEEAVAEAVADGWYLTTPEAKNAVNSVGKPLTAAEKKAAEKAAKAW